MFLGLFCCYNINDCAAHAPVQQPDPNQPKAEGAQMLAMRGEQLGVVTNWPLSLEAALQRWGTISPKAPCLTTMDTNGKPLYILTYGRCYVRTVRVIDISGHVYHSNLTVRTQPATLI